MIKYLKKLASIVAVSLVAIVAVSCNNTPYEKMTPEQQAKEYAKFQKDSVNLCTKDKVLAKAAVASAFDRIPENNGYFKKDKVTVVYDDDLKCWVGTVDYHVDRNGVYYKAQKVYHVRYWYVNNGLAKDAQLFNTVTPVTK